MFDKIREELKTIVGSEWGVGSYSPETLMILLNRELTPLEVDEVYVLYIATKSPTLFYQDLMFFMFACDVINGNQADFNYAPELSSLEIAFAIEEMSGMLEVSGGEEFDTSIREYVKSVLRNEGYSSPLPPFNRVLSDSDLEPGQTQEDTRAKDMAIKAYILAKKRGMQ